MRKGFLAALAVLALTAEAWAAEPSFERAFGLRLVGAPGERIGTHVATVDDVNGDGRDDVLVSGTRGRAFVVYGRAGGGTLDLTRLTDADGFVIEGGAGGVAAGDVNADGFADIVIGRPFAEPHGRLAAGVVTVVFGAPSQPALDLDGLPPGRGVHIDGARRYEHAGRAVSGAGDVNGDGFADVLIGAPAAGGYVQINAGAAYVVYGSAAPQPLDLRALTPDRGFRIAGEDQNDFFGYAVAAGGDVNGDGRDDIVVGAPQSENGTSPYGGSTYVFLGSPGGVDFPPSALTPARGFRFDAQGCFQRSGASVAGLGDINGDRFSDLAIGAPAWCRPAPFSGAAYLLLGAEARGSFASTRMRTYAYRTRGARRWQLGTTVARAGDLDGDGLAETLVRRGTSGRWLVVFGRKRGRGRRAAVNAGERGVVAAAGDTDGDGRNELVVGSPAGGGAYRGAAVLVTRASPPRSGRSRP